MTQYEREMRIKCLNYSMNGILVSDILLPYTNTIYLYSHSVFEMYLHSNLQTQWDLFTHLQTKRPNKKQMDNMFVIFKSRHKDASFRL